MGGGENRIACLPERTFMQDRYWLYQRENGVFYLQDKITGKQQSTRTKDDSAAKRLLAGKNQSVEQPMLNRSMAKAYLSAKSPELMERTWENVMDHYARSGVEATTLPLEYYETQKGQYQQGHAEHDRQ
jgi:hypothetical protein